MTRTRTTTPRRALALVMSVLMLMTAWVFVAPTKADAATAGNYYIKVKVTDKMEGTFSDTDSCNNSAGYLVVPTRKQDGTSGTTWYNSVKAGAWDKDNGSWEYTGNNPVNGFPTQVRCTTDTSPTSTSWMKNNNRTYASKIEFKIYVSSNGTNWTEVMSQTERTSKKGNWSDTKAVDSSKYPTASSIVILPAVLRP